MLMVAGMVTGFATSLGELIQLAGERLKVSCNTNPGVFGVQEI